MATHHHVAGLDQARLQGVDELNVILITNPAHCEHVPRRVTDISLD